MTGPSPAPGRPAALLEQLTSAIAGKDVDAAAALLADDLVAVVPDADDSPLGKAELVAWLRTLCDATGTMRLDLFDVIPATAEAVGARVLNTAFSAPPVQADDPVPTDVAPSWSSWPTITAANTDPDGRAIARLFFVTDCADQANHAAMTQTVRNWYESYVAQDVDGFLRPLAPDVEAINFSSDTTAVPVLREKMRQGYLGWVDGNTPGGFAVDDIIANGRYVAVAVQFLTVAKATGQQKMTNETHVFELTTDLEMLRAYFYYTNRCGYPSSPCAW